MFPFFRRCELGLFSIAACNGFTCHQLGPSHVKFEGLPYKSDIGFFLPWQIERLLWQLVFAEDGKFSWQASQIRLSLIFHA